MTDIKENFSTGLAYLFDSRGVNQAALAVSCGMSPQSITDYKKGRRKGDDIERNKIAFLLGYSEKEIQHLGSLIRSGVPGEKALIMVEEARSVIAAGQYVLPITQVSGKAHVGNVVNNGVNNGVMSVDDAPVESGEPRDEIRAEIEEWLAESFGDMSMSQKIAAREALRQHVPSFAAYVEQREQKR